MEERRDWVDFKQIKSEVTMQMVLDHYGIHLKQVGKELRGKCPIHGGESKSKHFSVSLSKNAFKCFFAQCGAHGNVLDLVASMERCSIREAGLKLKDWFKIGESHDPSPKQGEDTDQVVEVQRGIYRDQSDKGNGLYEVIIPLALSDDLEPVVVYRELFGDYRYFVAGPENFDQAAEPTFTIVKVF